MSQKYNMAVHTHFVTVHHKVLHETDEQKPMQFM